MTQSRSDLRTFLTLIVVEVSGANVVVRPARDVDRAYAAPLADVINAASATDIGVLIDPGPVTATVAEVGCRAVGESACWAG
jgi:hypothetical protein